MRRSGAAQQRRVALGRAVAGVALTALRDQVLGGALVDEPALVDQDDVGARDRHVLDQVGGDQHAAVDAEVTQQLTEVEALLGVEPDGRLVEQQHRRVVDDRLGDAGPAQHAAGERLHPGVGLGGETDPVDRPLHRAGDGRFGISLSQAMYSTNSRTVKRG